MKSRSLSVSVALLLGLCASSCAYDWTIGEPAGGGAGGGPTGGAPPSGGGGGGGGDGGGGGGGGGGGQTTTSTAGASCDDLRSDLAEKKKAAKACPSQGQLCDDLPGKDECGCDVSAVWDLAGAETAAYLAAVEALEQAGCAPSCGTCSGGTPFCSPLTGELFCSP